MSNVTLDEKTLYYQYLINNNSTSTMLNAINGTSSDSSYDMLSSLNSLGGYGDVGSISDFSTILENYLSGVNTTSYEDTMDAATMADKLSDVLDEAAETEDTNSLTYKTVQELYEYFSDQVSSKAAALMGTVPEQSGTESSKDSLETSTSASTIDQMNQAAMMGEEIDFSKFDEIVDSVFVEQTPMS